MNEYNQKYNKDDVFTRSMIVSLLAELNKKIVYYNRLDDGKVERVDVPCLYSIVGGNSERFLKDEFYYDALEQGKAIGDYERVPRCMVNLTGLNIVTEEQTNKYNHTKIVRESKGKLRTLYLNVEWIPVTLNFSCKVICMNNIELFKITESIISRIYKNPNYFKVDFGMFNVDACMSVPTDYSQQIPTEFGLNEKKEFSFEFNIDMKSFIPAFEHGLLLCEIDEMLENVPEDASGIIEFRANDYGEMEMRVGGVLETFRVSQYATSIEEPTHKSNTHKMPLPAKNEKELNKKDMLEGLINREIVK